MAVGEPIVQAASRVQTGSFDLRRRAARRRFALLGGEDCPAWGELLTHLGVVVRGQQVGERYFRTSNAAPWSVKTPRAVPPRWILKYALFTLSGRRSRQPVGRLRLAAVAGS